MNQQIPQLYIKIGYAAVGIIIACYMGSIWLDYRRDSATHAREMAQIEKEHSDVTQSLQAAKGNIQMRDTAAFSSYLKDAFSEASWYPSIHEIKASGDILQVWTSLPKQRQSDADTIGNLAFAFAKNDKNGQWIKGVVVKGHDASNLNERFNIR